MITKEVREQIIADFAQRHDGVYDPAVFVREVKNVGERHPAYAWFQWDDNVASKEYRIWQARIFAQGLTIKFRIEEVGQRGKMKIVETEMPMLMSPIVNRHSGGGYLISNPSDPEHIAMLCGEGAIALQSWLRRYQAALRSVGVPQRSIEQIISALERAAGDDKEPAAAE
jgi:hypothetical protein